MKSILILAFVFFSSMSAHAIDSRKCSNMLNNGLWKKYRYGGIGEHNANMMTQGTKRDGASTVSSDVTSETTTALLDPKYSSNVSTSETQSTSSWGECSAFAHADQLRKDREVYMAQNEHEVLIDIARGSGEHLKVITFYSACFAEAYDELSIKLQKNISDSNKVLNTKEICQSIDRIISENQSLKSQCAPI
jgi:hypothetical protein